VIGAGFAVMANIWLATSPTNAWAYGKMNTMVDIAHALAIEAHCPALKVDFDVLTATEHFYHIDVIGSGFDFNVMWSMISKRNGTMVSTSRDAACAAGRDLYGPNGARLRGLLIEN